jgi:hypothetical protein
LESGLLAEFDSPDAMVTAARRLRDLGYVRLDTYSPHAVVEVEEPLGLRRSGVRAVVLVLGLTGVVVAFLIQWLTNAVDYPLDVGGRPLASLPADVPICFETAVLFAACGAFFGTWALCRLPRLHRPLFEVEGFERASIDRFFIGIDSADPRYEPAVGDEMTRLGALRVVPFGEALR